MPSRTRARWHCCRTRARPADRSREGATTMKVILTHEVTGLGTAGDVVDVKDGYARNFLFRRGLATAWTKGGQKQVDAIAKGRQVREVKSLEEAQSIKGNLESKAVTVTAHAGPAAACSAPSPPV